MAGTKSPNGNDSKANKQTGLSGTMPSGQNLKTSDSSAAAERPITGGAPAPARASDGQGSAAKPPQTSAGSASNVVGRPPKSPVKGSFLQMSETGSNVSLTSPVPAAPPGHLTAEEAKARLQRGYDREEQQQSGVLNSRGGAPTPASAATRAPAGNVSNLGPLDAPPPSYSGHSGEADPSGHKTRRSEDRTQSWNPPPLFRGTGEVGPQSNRAPGGMPASPRAGTRGHNSELMHYPRLDDEQFFGGGSAAANKYKNSTTRLDEDESDNAETGTDRRSAPTANSSVKPRNPKRSHSTPVSQSDEPMASEDDLQQSFERNQAYIENDSRSSGHSDYMEVDEGPEEEEGTLIPAAKPGMKNPNDSKEHVYGNLPPKGRKGAQNSGRPRTILFYEQTKPYYGFTNFSPDVVVYDGKPYPTSEHLFQARKFLPHRPLLAEHIRTGNPGPRFAYTEARKFSPETRPDWYDTNIEVMDEILALKFTQHEHLLRQLMETGDAELIENSGVNDAFWGNGADGNGKNELGKALMRLRGKIRAHVSSSSGLSKLWKGRK